MFEDNLRQFLTALDGVANDNEGVTDTDVRQVLADVVHQRLVKKNSAFPIPDSFEMLDDDGEPSRKLDRRVKAIVEKFVKAAEASPEWQACTTEQQRQALIARDEIVTDEGNAYWLYLGPWDDGPPLPP